MAQQTDQLAAATFVGKDAAQFKHGQTVFVDPRAYARAADHELIWVAEDQGGRGCNCFKADVSPPFGRSPHG
jgi:hypothetical protein